MKRTLLILAVLACSTRPGTSQDAFEANAFESDVAKTAIAKFDERLQFLDRKLKEQISLAQVTLRSDLEAALSTVVDEKDFAEANRISALLDRKLDSFVERRTKTRSQAEDAPDEDKQLIANLKEQIAELKAKQKTPEPPDPVVGRWDYGNGNVCDYTPDGLVVLRGKPIGLWAKVGNKQYLVAFLRNFADGSSEEIMLHPDGKHATSVGSKSSVQLTRIEK
ncbi:hypothetical protein [Rhodopirellula sp. P2]|uniref:hypothetical protein n=1 Tax=Rhodopirellula sp. P2 TaxID=2127060 RepID=UPI00236795E6|nr:hypothetical protein [Rhodopirellula sp. P2]WDQ14878.1 hypothetical protein PSR62_14645 [Rhodopirellula sp. P2]